VFVIDQQEGQIRGVHEPRLHRDSPRVGWAPPDRIRVVIESGGHHSTTPKTSEINDRRGKREVENKTRTNNLMVEEPTVVFLTKTF
jgi:hypothetical protein